MEYNVIAYMHLETGLSFTSPHVKCWTLAVPVLLGSSSLLSADE